MGYGAAVPNVHISAVGGSGGVGGGGAGGAGWVRAGPVSNVSDTDGVLAGIVAVLDGCNAEENIHDRSFPEPTVGDWMHVAAVVDATGAAVSYVNLEKSDYDAPCKDWFTAARLLEERFEEIAIAADEYMQLDRYTGGYEATEYGGVLGDWVLEAGALVQRAAQTYVLGGALSCSPGACFGAATYDQVTGPILLSKIISEITGDFDASARVYLPGNATAAGLVFHFWDVFNYYQVYLSSALQRVVLQKFQFSHMGGGVEVLAEARLSSLLPRSWHAVRVVMSGIDITVEVDGEELLSVEDMEAVEQGMLGLVSIGAGGAAFDDIVVDDVSVDLSIGGHMGEDDHVFSGHIAVVRVYERPLSFEEISGNYWTEYDRFVTHEEKGLDYGGLGADEGTVAGARTFVFGSNFGIDGHVAEVELKLHNTIVVGAYVACAQVCVVL